MKYFILCAFKCYEFIHLYCTRPQWEPNPQLSRASLSTPPPPFLAAYWSMIQHTTFLSCQHEVLTLSVEYIMPKTCQIRSRSLQRIIETYHTHRISVKSPVLKIFIRIHSLMELLNLLRSRSPETTAGWHTVLQCWHEFHIETEGGGTVTPPLSNASDCTL